MVETIGIQGVTVIINGRDQFFTKDELSPGDELTYEQVVDKVKDSLPSGDQIIYTVTYFNGAGRPRDGQLKPGEKVKVQEGTGFNVDPTDLS